MKIVIADTGALITLGHIGLIGLIEKWISIGRHFSKVFLNKILIDIGESSMNEKQ